MLPTVAADTLKTVPYAAQVGGRALGVAGMKNLVPDANKRAAIEKAGNAIIAAAKQLANAYVARLVAEYVDQRVLLGKGRGIDKGFDAVVAASAETIRTSLPDRVTNNPEYRAIFPNGTEALTSPTIREDDTLAAEFRQSIHDSSLAVKADVLAMLDAVLPVVGPAATALRAGEEQVNALFQAELNARKLVVDTLWEERKVIESALGRGGKGLARFVFFDFRKQSDDAPAEDPTTQAPGPVPEPETK